MKNKLKRVLSFVLCLVMVFSLFPQITPQVRAADFAAGSGVDPIDGNGYPTSCKGPVVLALCFMGDTFPGEPSEHSVGDYLRYGLSFTRANDYFDASEVLQNVIDADGNVADGYVMGKYTSGWNTANSVTGIFDPNGLDDEYFTAKFNAALAEHEQDMISDVIAAKQSNNQTVGSTNPADYEIVWYIIKYQYNKSWFSTTGEWHVNGLIREKDKYSVVYDANGATVGSPPDGVIDMSYQDAKHYTVQTNNRGLSRGNAYNFIGWNTMPDGSGVFFSPGQADVDLTAIGLNPITLYAQWAEKEKWSVNWLNYDGNPVHVDIDLSEGSSVTYDGATPTRAPDANYVYIFEGWAETQNGTNLGTAPTITVPNNNKNMYALYRAEDRTYTVTWVNHTVIETDSNISKGGSARYDGATPTRSTTETEGYLFAGWSTQENGSVQYGLRDPVPVNSDLTLYAQFTLVPMRTVTWYSEDGSVVLATQRVLEGSQVSYPAGAPTQAGHSFVGWATSANGAAVYASGAPITVSGNMDLYADFTATLHTVRWENWDSSLLELDTNVPYGSTPEYNGVLPARADDVDKTYTFIGWTPAVHAVTGDITYTATYTNAPRAYTVTWNNYDNTLLKSESVHYGVTPNYSGATPERAETSTHTFTFIGWTPAVSPVSGNVTYTATYHEVEKLFEATVYVWEDPEIDTATGAVTSGAHADLDALTAYNMLYLRDVEDHAKIYPLTRSAEGTYTANLAHGSYDVVVKNGENYDRIIEERIVLPLDTASSDPDSTTADIIFYSVTYDFAGGSVGGQGSVVEYYRRGSNVTVSNYVPMNSLHRFDNWQLDGGSDTYLSGQRITVLGGGIIKPHVLTAKWTRSNDNVVINLTIHHHADPALSGAEGMNPHPGSVPIDLHLTRRPEGGGDYWEEGKRYLNGSNWVTAENTVNKTDAESGGGYATSTTTLSFEADVTGFGNLPYDWDYSANILLNDYFLVERTVTETESANGDTTYTVDAVLQYRPDLFNLNYKVVIDSSVPEELIPDSVDLKILSYKNGAWSPISRHQNSSVDLRFEDAHAGDFISGSYPVPLQDQLNNDFYYRAAVVGFTAPDGTELSASGGLVNYSSDPTGASETYQYALGAYTAVVTVTSDKTALGAAGVYGDGNSQAAGTKILVTVYANPHTVTFDPNGGKLNGDTANLVLKNQFRIPVLGNYIPTREGGYVFDGWQRNGGAAVTGVPITEDVTLTATWKAPLTVSGEVRISTTDSNGDTLRADGLPKTLTVTLERTTSSGDKIIVQSKTYTLTASDYAGGLGVVPYAFDPVAQDGSSYEVHVNVTNYNTAFLNEPGSNTATTLNHAESYTGSRSAIDSDGNHNALVYAFLIFNPQEFNLTWKVDASGIGAAFRPDSLDIVIRCASENDTSVPFDEWEPIIQHYSGGVYHPTRTYLESSGTATGFYPVWTVDPEGYAFDYALKVHHWIKATTPHEVTADTPFTVTYNPAVAWFNGTKQVTANPAQDDLLITLSPKDYTITYVLNAGADPVQGLIGEPTHHTWSHETTGIPETLNRDGYDFLGWTCNVPGAYADGKIRADVAQNVTLTAQWRKQKVVTFRVVNGTWEDDTIAEIGRNVSLDAHGNGSMVIPTGMKAAYGYAGGSWSDPALAGGTLTVSGDSPATYVYTFERQYHTVSYDTDGKNGPDDSDSVAHGDYVRVDPAGGVWKESASWQDLRIEEAQTLAAPTRVGYLFAGWQRHYLEDTTSHPSSTVTHRYVAQWLHDENDDGIADILQKKIIFKIENGTWDGTNADPIVEFVTLDGSGKADITSVIPTGMHPKAGFLAMDAFWSPTMPAGNIVTGNGEVTFTYHHYTTVTYSDYTQNGAQEQFLILPGSYIAVDPAGGTWDGNTSLTVLQINGPDVLEDAVYTNHDFLGWELSLPEGQSEYVFTAKWKKDSYTILWKNEGGALLETDENVELGLMPEYNGVTPTKASSAEFDYTFKGWTPTVIAAEANATYTAEYTAVRRSYTVTWKNWDGSVLDTDTVEYGQMPAFAGVPSRPASKEHTYAFDGWDQTLAAVTADVTYTATYSETTNQYTITWLDEDGTQLQSGLVNYGSMPAPPADPTKAATAQHTYTFSGWSPVVAAVTGNAVYRATYSSNVNKYTVTWYEEDGVSVIETAEVEYGKVPAAPVPPVKANTAQYTFLFSGWKNGETTYIPASIPAVTGNVSYIAQYAQTTNKYTVTWKDYNGTELEKDTQVEYGTTPAFGATHKLTTEDANSDYTFLGWYLSTDGEKNVVNLAEQTVTGNVTYIAKYQITSKARTVTVHVWVNATDSDGTGGTPSTIETVTNAERSNVYLVPEASVSDPASYIQAGWDDTAKAYTASLMPGNYLLYAGNTAATAVLEANQLVGIVNTNETVNILYNSVTYDAGSGSFAGGQKTITEYYKSSYGPVYVSKTVPSLSGKVFTHWHDALDTVYNASTNAVLVELTDKITAGYTLTAHWSDATDVQVVVNIDTKDANGQDDTSFSGKTLSLQLAGKAGTSGSSVPYSAIYGTNITSQYTTSDSAWSVSGVVYTFTKTYANQRGDYVYQATAQMANYALKSISVSGNTVTIDLKYDPAGFDLQFKVVVDSSVPDELVPRAVDVQIVFFDRETGTWKMLSNTQNKALEVALTKDGTGKWSGTGTYHVWSEYTSGSYTGQLYLYRIAITDFDLGTSRGSLAATNATGSDAFKVYSSVAGNYHPAGAYTADVTVIDLGCSNGEAGGLLGSHDSSGTQHGTITATIKMNGYTVVQHYNDGSTADKTTEKVFLTPVLDKPTYTGHSFAGWWTKDGTGGDWGEQITAAGVAIKNLVSGGTTLNLYARWNQDLTVTGTVTVSNKYEGSLLYDHDRPDSVQVELRNTQTNALVASAKVDLTDDSSDDFRSGTYTFTNVPDNGVSYYISVVAPNYDVRFRNETVAAGADYSSTLYAVVDINGDDQAVVDVHMAFAPHNFSLEYTVDATNIGTNFRPSEAGVVVLSGSSNTDPQSWDIIAQQLEGGTVNAHTVAIDAATGKPVASAHGGATGIWHHYPVWRRSPFGDLYEYAIQLWTLKINGVTYGRSDMASAPFTVIYAPALAWYDSATGKQTAPPVALSSGITLTHPDSGNPHGLVAYIVPKSYTVTYELGRIGTVSGASSVDGNTARGSFLWSHGLAELPVAVPTVATGITFGGWWTKDGTGGDWGTKVTSISADTKENKTFYARWNYTVTWNADNGSASTSESVLEGVVPTAPADPTKAADARYSYTFTGWSPTIAAVNGNVTYTAQYAANTNSYTVTWKNGDTVLDTNTVDYGTMPAYTGAVPTKASTAQYSYTFSGWTPVLATVTGDVTYNATFTQTERSYTVTWKNHDGSTLDVDANVGYGVMPHYDGATPVKEGNAQYSYTFTGWSPAVVGVTGDAAYTAQFEEHVNKYTVIWKNWDGTVLETDDLVPYGEMASYDDATPARPATEQYLYTFIGWDAEPSAVTGNVTYTAQFFRATQTYEVIWKNADGTTLETDSSVPFGAVPKYDGAEPTQAADAQYTYTFDKWSPTVSAVTGNITYTAQYSTTVNKYMVTWKNDNGDVLKSEVLAYGAMPTFDGTPAKAATAQYTYTFAGWDNTPAAVTGDATYTATYTSQVNNYTIKWIDWDGTVLKEETLPYGTMPVAPANPTRPEHDGYTFDFLQWDEVITIVTRDVTYQALYTSNAPAYQIVWVDENGNQLHEETHYLDDTPIYPDSDPVKADTVQYTYAFAGWKVMGGGDTLYSSNALPAVTGSVTYQAQFSSALRTYPVTWRNENGTTLMTEQVAYGTVPSYSGATPTKDETDEFTFSFSGWDTEPVAVTGAATYTATYTGAKRSYTVTWQNENGTELAVDTVEYGQMPVYTGATPTKAGTGHYSYVHSGWTPELHPVTRDVTYKATYTMKHNRYTVTWKDEDGTVLRTDLLDYGELPAYGTDPVKTGDAQYSYTFVAWTPSIAAVTRDITYTATYSTQLNRYTVTWKNDNGAVLATEEVEYGTVPTYTGTPAKQATAQYSYTFKGWDNTPVAVTGDVTYTATYSETLNRYTVTWVNWDGTVLETDTDVPYGTTPTYDGADPTRPDTAEHKFTWNLWDKVVSSVTGDVTYQAIFVDRANTYTIVWKNHDGTVLETDKDVPYGAMPSYDGATPVKEGDAQHSYTHSGWTPEVKVVSADAEYTATFEQAGNSYTVTYTDGVDGSEIFADQSYTVAYGTKTPAFDGTPVRAGYTFNGWNPAASETVTKNVIYTAQWTAEAPTIPIEPPVTATGSAKLVKVDADDQSTRLKNVVFELYRSSGVSLGSYITNVNGEITASALVPGDYYWVETRPAEGYVLDSTKHRFTVVDGQTAAITVTNKHSSVPAVFSGDHYAYIVGYSDGTVRPEAYITRAEVATIFFRLLDEQTRDQYYTKENSFSDVERGMWFNTAVSTMASMGIISGYPDGTFHPNANITRAEFAAIAARFDSNGNTTGVSFLDIYDHWAKKEINIAANNGWILGYEDGTFKPNQRITRAEAMAMVNRVLQRIPENKEDLLNSMVKWSDNADTRKWYYLTVQEATNSHDYGRKHNGYEYWIAIREVPDWTKLER